MSGLMYGCITPHPPIMLPQIGRGREAAMSDSIDAMRKVAHELAQKDVDTALIVSPHGTVYPDAMGILTGPFSEGTMEQWGATDMSYQFDSDTELVEALQKEVKDAEIPLRSIGMSRYDLDHGVLVPLYFLIDVLETRPLVPLSFSMLPLETHLEFGRAIRRAIEHTGKSVAFIASGDLSHRLLPDAPAGYDPMGQVFDQDLIKAVESLDMGAILDMEPDLVIRAGECGLRSIVTLLGALEGLDVTPEVLSYEGPFGVGYLTASFTVNARASVTDPRPLLQLARDSVEHYVQTDDTKPPPVELTPEMQRKAGTFVPIKTHGQLSGCIGTVHPIGTNVAEEVINNAIASASRDPRFPPITLGELPHLDYSVDVLSPLESIEGLSQLDPEIYGVVVRNSERTGVLLPGLDEIKTAEQQVDVCRLKAGIGSGEQLELFRFQVTRYQLGG